MKPKEIGSQHNDTLVRATRSAYAPDGTASALQKLIIPTRSTACQIPHSYSYLFRFTYSLRDTEFKFKSLILTRHAA